MNIQQIIDQDPRALEIRQKYQYLVQQKNQLIMKISGVEADIIKLMGAYETISKEIIDKLKGKPLVPAATDTVAAEPEPVDPGDAPIVPEPNVDDGFADAKSEVVEQVIPPTAENTNPAGSQE